MNKINVGWVELSTFEWICNEMKLFIIKVEKLQGIEHNCEKHHN